MTCEIVVSRRDREELSGWMVLTSNWYGEVPNELVVEGNRTQRERYMNGDSHRLLDNQRDWRIDVRDALISHLKLSCRAGYSLKSAEYVEIGFEINLTHGRSGLIEYQHLLADRLRGDGFTAQESIDADGKSEIVISGPGQTPIVIIGLGSKDDQDYNPDLVLVWIDEWKPNTDKNLSNISYLVNVTNKFIKAIYEVLKIEEPDIRFDIAYETELV